MIRRIFILFVLAAIIVAGGCAPSGKFVRREYIPKEGEGKIIEEEYSGWWWSPQSISHGMAEVRESQEIPPAIARAIDKDPSLARDVAWGRHDPRVIVRQTWEMKGEFEGIPYWGDGRYIWYKGSTWPVQGFYDYMKYLEYK